MIDVNFEEGVVILFVVAALVLAVASAVTVWNLSDSHGGSDSTSTALSCVVGVFAALGWFLALVALFEKGGPVELRVSEGGAWGLGFAAFVAAIAIGVAAGALFDDENQRLAWGFGVFTLTAVPFFMLLLWLFNEPVRHALR